MSRSKNRKIADLISGGTFDDGVVAASEVTGLATVATSGSFNDLSNQPTPFDPSTLGTASTQATGAFATAAQGTTADAALPKAGGAVTGNVTFGDNDKAIFGAGSDLQIFHLSANNASYIQEQNASASLNIDGTDVYIRSYPEGDNMIIAERDGAVTLHYDNATKIATTTSGIDVTGTVNADALTGIGSIDATTAAAIGAAGVGGSSTLISEDVSVGTGATFSISFTGNYRAYRLILNDVKPSGNYKTLQWRFTNGSGTPITSNAYITHYQVKTFTASHTVGGEMRINEWYANTGSTDAAYIDMTIFNTNETSKMTWVHGHQVSSADDAYMATFRGQISTLLGGGGANNSIYFSNKEGGNFSSGTYSLWGIN